MILWKSGGPICMSQEDPKCPSCTKSFRFSGPNLHKLNNSTFGNIFKEKDAIQNELETMQLNIMNNGYTDEIKFKEKEILAWLNKCCEQEETLLKQKSKVACIKEGERNISFFHCSTLQYRMRNMIIRLKTDDGSILEEHTDLEKELLGFYKNMTWW